MTVDGHLPRLGCFRRHRGDPRITMQDRTGAVRSRRECSMAVGTVKSNGHEWKGAAEWKAANPRANAGTRRGGSANQECFVASVPSSAPVSNQSTVASDPQSMTSGTGRYGRAHRRRSTSLRAVGKWPNRVAFRKWVSRPFGSSRRQAACSAHSEATDHPQPAYFERIGSGGGSDTSRPYDELAARSLYAAAYKAYAAPMSSDTIFVRN